VVTQGWVINLRSYTMDHGLRYTGLDTTRLEGVGRLTTKCYTTGGVRGVSPSSITSAVIVDTYGTRAHYHKSPVIGARAAGAPLNSK